MKDRWIVAAGVAGFAGVGLGAASTHLAGGGSPTLLDTAYRFLLFHAPALGLVGVLERLQPSRTLVLAGLLLTAGLLCFAGGLTLLALTDSPLGQWSTPAGGTLLLAGWLTLAWYGLRG
ncbi:MAG TPA: DUF423 domain-containing protein [Stellaceae bacterium]|nr:DUF423 domain-containing protein [Stellaceae bacterium]